MSRSVVLAGTPRCEGCRLPPRWCVCPALAPVVTPLRIDILTHAREHTRPTSTGWLIERAVTGARRHVYRDHARDLPDALAAPGRQLWILHPRGEPLDRIPGPRPDPAGLQVLLLDGSWGEAGKMLRAVEHWGRPVRLPLGGQSRYWLRDQRCPGELSTAEALIGLLSALDLAPAANLLRLHFELLVFACLLARGRNPEADRYLGDSPIRTELAGFLARLRERRPADPPSPKPARPAHGQTLAPPGPG